MKKLPQNPLVILTAVFTVFIVGFFFGRATSPQDVQVSRQLLQSRTRNEALISTAEPELSQPSAPDSTDSQLITPVNINTATLDELAALPEIGEVLAQRIIDYRQAHGPFSSVAQLVNVEGIGELRLKAIKDLITVGQEE